MQQASSAFQQENQCSRLFLLSYLVAYQWRTLAACCTWHTCTLAKSMVCTKPMTKHMKRILLSCMCSCSAQTQRCTTIPGGCWYTTARHPSKYQHPPFLILQDLCQQSAERYHSSRSCFVFSPQPPSGTKTWTGYSQGLPCKPCCRGPVLVQTLLGCCG